jgi:hypothetical protein
MLVSVSKDVIKSSAHSVFWYIDTVKEADVRFLQTVTKPQQKRGTDQGFCLVPPSQVIN